MSAPTAIPPTLSTSETALLTATLPVVGGAIDEITPAFYRRMFGEHPELLRNLFNRGNQARGAQQRALAASIVTYASAIAAGDGTPPMLSRIAHKHASLGVTEAQYEIVHDCLFAAIVEVLGADVVTPEIAAVWDHVYWLMAADLIRAEKELYRQSNVEPGDVFCVARVTNRASDGHDRAVFTLESDDIARPLRSYRGGQYISLGVHLPDGARQLRQFSLVGDGRPERYVVAVERAGGDGRPDGEVSNFLLDHVFAGDLVDVTVPFGELTLDGTGHSPLVMVAAGIGITPMLAMLHELAEHDRDRSVHVLHVCESSDTQPLRRELLGALGGLGNATLTGTAALDPDRLRAVATIDDAHVFLCGGTRFLQGVRDDLRRWNVPEERTHYELFGPNDWLLGTN
ncbi:globin domain-containing protein [Rhodococcus rhodnii]|uniref:nitric oxide dioxygenase n=1 Tax=Rhodococcus rhodnii LMG 5362 TaxID=1273125 RepID=R7WQA6_9NOCA|nr:globin domain-containing protein [Rhodococcus rhodnii]EOM77450.1 nitric oxide dioxygenase [Rhodococcus rhodnii LMG 5362]